MLTFVLESFVTSWLHCSFKQKQRKIWMAYVKVLKKKTNQPFTHT